MRRRKANYVQTGEEGKIRKLQKQKNTGVKESEKTAIVKILDEKRIFETKIKIISITI